MVCILLDIWVLIGRVIELNNWFGIWGCIFGNICGGRLVNLEEIFFKLFWIMVEVKVIWGVCGVVFVVFGGLVGILLIIGDGVGSWDVVILCEILFVILFINVFRNCGEIKVFWLGVLIGEVVVDIGVDDVIFLGCLGCEDKVLVVVEFVCILVWGLICIFDVWEFGCWVGIFGMMKLK